MSKSMKYTLYLNYINIKYFLGPENSEQHRHCTHRIPEAIAYIKTEQDCAVRCALK